MSDKAFVFDLCISKHDATAVKKKKKNTLVDRSGLFILSGLIYPRGIVLLMAPKENPTSWPNIKATQAEVRQDQLGFLSLGLSVETVMKRE